MATSPVHQFSSSPPAALTAVAQPRETQQEGRIKPSFISAPVQNEVTPRGCEITAHSQVPSPAPEVPRQRSRFVRGVRPAPCPLPLAVAAPPPPPSGVALRSRGGAAGRAGDAVGSRREVLPAVLPRLRRRLVGVAPALRMRRRDGAVSGGGGGGGERPGGRGAGDRGSCRGRVRCAAPRDCSAPQFSGDCGERLCSSPGAARPAAGLKDAWSGRGGKVLRSAAGTRVVVIRRAHLISR